MEAVTNFPSEQHGRKYFLNNRFRVTTNTNTCIVNSIQHLSFREITFWATLGNDYEPKSQLSTPPSPTPHTFKPSK